LPQPIEHAFARSQVLALEANPTSIEAIRAALAQSFYAPPDQLRSHLPQDIYRRAEQAARRYQLPLEVVHQMRPATLGMALAMAEAEKNGFDSKLGLDVYLAKRAQNEGKRIVELESMMEQAQLINRLSAGVQVAMLDATLQEIGSGELRNRTNELFDAWQTGNRDWLLELTQRDNQHLASVMAEEFRGKIYTKRNLNMTRKVERLLKGRETGFVAVGTAHLLGESGLVEQLARKGYLTRRVDTLER